MTISEYEALFNDMGLPDDLMGELARNATIKKLEALEQEGEIDMRLQRENIALMYFDGFYDAATKFKDRVHEFMGFRVPAGMENPHKDRQSVIAGPAA